MFIIMYNEFYASFPEIFARGRWCDVAGGVTGQSRIKAPLSARGSRLGAGKGSDSPPARTRFW